MSGFIPAEVEMTYRATYTYSSRFFRNIYEGDRDQEQLRNLHCIYRKWQRNATRIYFSIMRNTKKVKDGEGVIVFNWLLRFTPKGPGGTKNGYKSAPNGLPWHNQNQRKQRGSFSGEIVTPSKHPVSFEFFLTLGSSKIPGSAVSRGKGELAELF